MKKLYTVPASLLESEGEIELNEDCVFIVDEDGNVVREEVSDDASDDRAQ